jgi:NAD-dependent DNA ligase
MELVKEFQKDPNDFIENNNNVKQLIKLAKFLSSKYYSSGPIVSDEEYDLLIDAIRNLEPNNSFFKEIGIDCKQNNIVELPFYMGSMDKIKKSEDVIDWSHKYGGPYYISDKLDGISALLELDKTNGNKLYTRGNGLKGNDITPLLKYLHIPQLDDEYVVVRGELIMCKDKFKKYSDKMANARNLVCGTVNSKRVNKERMNDIDFVAYEIVEPWLPVKDQFKALKTNKFKTVYNTVLDNINIDNLSTLLKERRDKSEYDIDGIIVSYGKPKKRLEDGNPDYAFAFKQTFENQTVNVTVLDVEWNESKDGYLKPRLILEPTKLSGVTIKYVTAFNAKYVQDNDIGPNTIIKLVRSGDVIPHILQVVKSTKAKMPVIDYTWTDTKVDIIAKKQSMDGLIQSLTFSVQKLKIKNVNEGIIKKLVENDKDIKTIIDLLNIDKNFLLDLDSFQEKKANLVFNSIQEAVQNMTLLDFMVASNTLGRGLGERKIKKILDTYPNIIAEHKKDIYNKIIKLEGFDEVTTNLFTNNLDDFIKLFNKLPSKLQKQLLIIKEKQNVNNRFKDLKIVFSGFRNKEWEQIIEEEGGEVVSTVSKNTKILIAKEEDIKMKNNAKIKKAIELNVKILTPEEFNKKYMES